MSEVLSSNPYLRSVQKLRETTQAHLLSGTPSGMPADQVGIAFAKVSARYQVLREVEEIIKDLISKGDTIEND